jgi:hypothetical protein
VSQSQPSDETAYLMAPGLFPADVCAEQGHLMMYHRVTNEPVCCQRCGKTIDQIEEEEQQ